jgi:hypothetical protein
VVSPAQPTPATQPTTTSAENPVVTPTPEPEIPSQTFVLAPEWKSTSRRRATWCKPQLGNCPG